MAPSRCLAAAVAFAVLLACVPSHGQGLNDLACDHDGKPAQPGNLRVSGNKMDGENKYSGEKLHSALHAGCGRPARARPAP